MYFFSIFLNKTTFFPTLSSQNLSQRPNQSLAKIIYYLYVIGNILS